MILWLRVSWLLAEFLQEFTAFSRRAITRAAIGVSVLQMHAINGYRAIPSAVDVATTI